MNFKGFIGPAYKLDSVNVDCQRCVNLYPEMIQSGNGKDGSIAYLKSTPGLIKIAEVGEGPIRGLHVDLKGDLFVVSDYTSVPNKRGFYKVTFDGTDYSVTHLFDKTYDLSEDINKPVNISSFKILEYGTYGPFPGTSKDWETYYTVFSDGVYSDALYGSTTYYKEIPEASVSSVGSVGQDGAEGPDWLDSSHSAWIDGYLIFSSAKQNSFFVSDLNSINLSSLSFATSEGNLDRINGLIANGRDLWIFNERSIEIFSDTGNADFPFERIQGGYVEKGCLAPYSIAKIENTIFWLGRDQFGQGQVYAASSINPQRISTHAIEQAISSYANPEKATAYTYSKNGHSFYCLNFDESTWVFDVATGLWHERQSDDGSGSLKRNLGDFCVFSQNWSKHIVGSYRDNKIYILDDDTYVDDEFAITRIRTSPHITNDLKRITCHSFTLDMEVGVGLDGDVLGSDPQVMLSYSKDNGHTWSSESWASAGKNIGGVGEFRKRVIWRRLGQFRDLVVQVKITDPVKVRLINASYELELAGS